MPQDDDRQHRDDAQRSRHPVLRFLPLLLIAAGFAAFFALGLDAYISEQALRDNRAALTAWVGEHGVLAGLASVAAYAAVAALSLPVGTFLTVVIGFLFGAVLGTCYVVVGATIGACLIFLAARTAFADLLHAKAGPFLRRMEDGFRDNAFSYMLLLRLVPLFPFWLVNLVPGLLGVPFAAYATGTLIGIIPGAFAYALFGSGIGSILDTGEPLSFAGVLTPQFVAGLCALGVLALVPVIYKMVKGRASA